MTVLICLAMTVILIYVYESNEPIEEMSDKEIFMKRKVDKSKPILEENILEFEYLEFIWREKLYCSQNIGQNHS